LNFAVLKRPIVFVPFLGLLVAAFVLWRSLQGPVLDAYRLESRPLLQTVVATGRVITTSRAQVGSEVTGVVLERRVKEGDRVKPGDVLLVLRADDLAARVREAEGALRSLLASTRPQAEAALRQADGQLAQASRERARRADLVARQLVSREQAEQAEQAETVARAAADRARVAAAALAPGASEEAQLRERLAAAKAQLAKTVLRADRPGLVLTRNAEPGDVVQPSRVLFEIALDGATEILLPVDEKNLSVLKLGQRATCIADAFTDRSFGAVLTFIAPSIDAQRGTADLRLTVNPVPAFLRQDMTVSVNIETGRRDAALVVPNDALLDVAGDHAAVLAVRDGRIARSDVTLGLRGLASSQILSGVTAADRVLASAADVKRAVGSRTRTTLLPLPGGASMASTRRELPVNFN
jgi:HlyD family secretion protein